MPGADDAQALVADPAVLLGRRDAQGDQLPDGARRQAVAADLLAGEVRLLEEQDVQPAHGEVGGGRRPAWAGADDDDIGTLGPGDIIGPVEVGETRTTHGSQHASNLLVNNFTNSLGNPTPERTACQIRQS